MFMRQHVKTEWKCLRMAFDIPVCRESEKDMLNHIEYYLGAEQSEPFSRDQSMQPACLTIFSRSIFPSRLIWQSQVCSVRVWKKSQMLEFKNNFCDVKKKCDSYSSVLLTFSWSFVLKGLLWKSIGISRKKNTKEKSWINKIKYLLWNWYVSLQARRDWFT